MKRYQTASKEFSRTWRRGKQYTYPELRMLARRRGLDIIRHKKQVTLSNARGEKIIFVEMAEPLAPEKTPQRVSTLAALASLKLPAPNI